jgi:hypothetical protein
MPRAIKHRNVFLVCFLTLITLGLYSLYWAVSSKRDINSRGGKIPSTWITLIPFAYLYYMYKYADGFAKTVKKDNNTILYYLVFMFVPFGLQIVAQMGLNHVAANEPPPAPGVTLAA